MAQGSYVERGRLNNAKPSNALPMPRPVLTQRPKADVRAEIAALCDGVTVTRCEPHKKTKGVRRMSDVPGFIGNDGPQVTRWHQPRLYGARIVCRQ